ncbi:unnamed protein product [Amoebophrya sp. A120]|nr:unnamed protein product [Amoebophrya sp. A120]|eukprot:GSA120T00002426001.1
MLELEEFSFRDLASVLFPDWLSSTDEVIGIIAEAQRTGHLATERADVKEVAFTMNKVSATGSSYTTRYLCGADLPVLAELESGVCYASARGELGLVVNYSMSRTKWFPSLGLPEYEVWFYDAVLILVGLLCSLCLWFNVKAFLSLFAAARGAKPVQLVVEDEVTLVDAKQYQQVAPVLDVTATTTLLDDEVDLEDSAVEDKSVSVEPVSVVEKEEEKVPTPVTEASGSEDRLQDAVPQEAAAVPERTTAIPEGSYEETTPAPAVDDGGASSSSDMISPAMTQTTAGASKISKGTRTLKRRLSSCCGVSKVQEEATYTLDSA